MQGVSLCCWPDARGVGVWLTGASLVLTGDSRRPVPPPARPEARPHLGASPFAPGEWLSHPGPLEPALGRV